jgi:uncharacterized repeat protein (TIGR02543 family)
VLDSDIFESVTNRALSADSIEKNASFTAENNSIATAGYYGSSIKYSTAPVYTEKTLLYTFDAEIKEGASIGSFVATIKDDSNASLLPLLTVEIDNGTIPGDGDHQPQTFMITSSAIANGTISPSGEVVVNETSDAAFTITPDPGYEIETIIVDSLVYPDDSIQGLTVDDKGVGHYTFSNVTTNHAISASFIQVHQITVDNTDLNGTISPVSIKVLDGGSQSFIITPNTGYVIDEFKIDGVVTDVEINNADVGTYTFTNVKATHTIAATYKEAIRYEDSEGNAISPINFGIFHAGDFAAPTPKAITVYNDSKVAVSFETPTIATPFAIVGATPGTIAAGGATTFSVSATGNLPLGEYAKTLSISVGGNQKDIPVSLNSYHRIYNEADEGVIVRTDYAGMSGGINDVPTIIPSNDYLQMNTMYRAGTGESQGFGQFSKAYALNVRPAPGYQLDNISMKFVDSHGDTHWADEQTLRSWVENDSSMAGLAYGAFGETYFNEGQGDITIYATSSAIKFDLTPVASSHGAITLSDSQLDITEVPAFTDVTFKVTPNKGYHITRIFDSAINGALTEGEGADYTIDADGIASYSVTGIDKVHTISAEYAPDEYAVTFDSNGGSSVSPTGITVTYGEEYAGGEGLVDSKFPMPTRENYTFAGWYTTPDAIDVALAAHITEEQAVSIGYAHTLYAKWTKLPDNPPGGGTPGGGTNPPGGGSSTSPGGNTGKTPVTGANSIGGSDEKSLITINTAGGGRVTVREGAKISSIAKPTKKGYKFKGWYSAAKGGKKIAATTKITAQTKIFAQWTANKYKIKFNANKGKVKVKSKKVTFAGKYGKLVKPTKKGYTFKGWYTKKNGGKKITAGSKVKITKTTTLYAHWKKK